MTIVLYGDPRTKKNSMRLIKCGNYPRLMPSKAYEEYEQSCLMQLKHGELIDYPVNVACKFYMRTRRKVDLVNLLESIDDILVKGMILQDDNSGIIQGHDGSRVLYDKENPRTEVEITQMENEIIKLLGILIGGTEAVGDSEADNKIEANLKTLIDVTNWCLDGIHKSSRTRHRFERSMRDVGERAFASLAEIRDWLNEVIENG